MKIQTQCRTCVLSLRARGPRSSVVPSEERGSFTCTGQAGCNVPRVVCIAPLTLPWTRDAQVADGIKSLYIWEGAVHVGCLEMIHVIVTNSTEPN